MSKLEAKLRYAEFKIGDFNIATYSESGMQNTMTGTPFFASPEMLAQRAYSYQNDVWQLGVSMY